MLLASVIQATICFGVQKWALAGLVHVHVRALIPRSKSGDDSLNRSIPPVTVQ